MISLKRILFPTDFSENSKCAQRYAMAFVEQFQAELHVLHVLEDVTLMLPEPGSAISLPPNYLTEQKQAVEGALDRLLPPDWASRHHYIRATRMGNPFAEIVKYAKEQETDLIVIGTHGRSGLMHMLMGSVAEKIVRKAPCPVLTVHPERHHFVEP